MDSSIASVLTSLRPDIFLFPISLVLDIDKYFSYFIYFI